jgi:hypothetical protein
LVGNETVADLAAPSITRERAAVASWSVSRFIVAAAFIVGTALRLGPVLLADFPLNDGGMFFAMIRDLQAAHYQLPLFTSYNNAGIPFTYPPLPFYLAGILDDLTPLSLFDVLRFFPALTTMLSMVAFYRLARSFHSSSAGVAASVVTFALLPESFIWPIMGGGLTRAMGMLFALLAMREAYRLYSRDEPRAVPWLIVWCSLTALSHIEWVWLLAVTCGAMCLSHCRSRRALMLSIGVAFTTLICTAPWWAWVLIHHGWAPFDAALKSGYGTTANAAAGAIAPAQVLATVAVLVILALRKRRLFCFGWIGLILLFNLRSLFRFATIPIALATGQLFDGPPNASGVPTAEGASAEPPRGASAALRLGFPLALALLTWIEVLGPLMLTQGLGYLVPLAGNERAAMEWIDRSTPESSTFLVVTGNSWAVDRSAEWFPVLANRTSVATVQGTEWLPGGAFERAIDAQVEFGQCLHTEVQCIDTWADALGASFTHVYLASHSVGDCCDALQEAMRNDPAYALIHEAGGVSIFARLPAPRP